MAKKNPFVFTLGFNKTNPSHIRVAQILNETENKAQLIVNAVLQYLGESNGDQKMEFDMDAMQSVVAAMVKREVQKAMMSYGASDDVRNNNMEDEKIYDLTDNLETVPQNEELAKNVLDAMSAFRKM